MDKKRPSLDGFVVRRSSTELGAQHTTSHQKTGTSRRRQSSHGDEPADEGIARRPSRTTVGTASIRQSLEAIDQGEGAPAKLTRRERRRVRKERRKSSKKRRIIKWSIIFVITAVVAVFGYVVAKGLLSSNSIFQGGIFDLIQHQPLKKDANGRSNFLILGTSEDDPGHNGAMLTDSMMVLSIDQEKKDAYMFSIPRDLYVNYGTACLAGYKGKINNYFSCANEGTDTAAELDRLAKTQKLVGDIAGLDIQYGIHVNYTVMRDLIKAIGGNITVTIESRDPRGQMDSIFDWKCGKRYERKTKCPPNGHYIDYPNGPVTLDGEHALYLAQARGDAWPTYGFEQSNFDRERNQQKILMAIREKALSAGTLTNIGAVTGLMDALGNNLRTNIQKSEVRTLMDVAQAIKQSDIKSIDLNTTDNPILTSGSLGGAGSSVYPRAGVFDYSELRALLAKKLSTNPVVREGAKVVVLNGTNVSGVARTESDKLKQKGYTISAVDDAPKGTYKPIEVYKIGKGNDATSAALAALYGVAVQTTPPPLPVANDVSFVIVVGTAPSKPSQ